MDEGMDGDMGAAIATIVGSPSWITGWLGFLMKDAMANTRVKGMMKRRGFFMFKIS